ncbi:hypothetical protein ACFFX0_19645 [Citricoccus parietis]|uniref:Uncharacterized protein n=1 Tax=Citricoccus parietis TaxID=592307 RepID=A0ABV5G489_9MICC
MDGGAVRRPGPTSAGPLQRRPAGRRRAPVRRAASRCTTRPGTAGRSVMR